MRLNEKLQCLRDTRLYTCLDVFASSGAHKHFQELKTIKGIVRILVLVNLFKVRRLKPGVNDA